jgi:hypothetical protein
MSHQWIAHNLDSPHRNIAQNAASSHRFSVLLLKTPITGAAEPPVVGSIEVLIGNFSGELDFPGMIFSSMPFSCDRPELRAAESLFMKPRIVGVDIAPICERMQRGRWFV